MNISLIAAMGKNRVIGKDNSLPWPPHPADMRHFRELTLSKIVIMGRRTFESIGGPLYGRSNVVLSKGPLYQAGQVLIARDSNGIEFLLAGSIEQVISYANTFAGNSEVMVIGGASVYEQFLPYANKIYLTIVSAEFEGDTYFPRYNPEEWRVQNITCKYANKDNPYHLSFVEILRISS